MPAISQSDNNQLPVNNTVHVAQGQIDDLSLVIVPFKIESERKFNSNADILKLHITTTRKQPRSRRHGPFNRRVYT